ncbi:thioredoxin-like domain-containing protein [Micromonospora sp. NPDC006766]|uniref:TlpA family protein disulfide reductase n=1 Tax=Micromonospora sp. NPDC006766 TaxID=3154778 RepID=UPI0033F36B96
MALLTVAVVLVAALGLLNLVLMLGVIRRLREHTELLSDRPSPQAEVMLEAGSTPGDFVSTTVDGQLRTRADIPPMTLMAFVSPACEHCEAQLPLLIDRARAMPGGTEHVWIVVVGKAGPEVDAYAAQFTGLATVFVEPGSGPLPLAFEVKGYPAFALLDEQGVVRSTTHGLARLDLPVAR